MKRKEKNKRKGPENCRSPTQRQKFITIKSVKGKKQTNKQLKSLIRFHSVKNIGNYNRAGSGRKVKKKKKERKKRKIKIQKKLQNKSKQE